MVAAVVAAAQVLFTVMVEMVGTVEMRDKAAMARTEEPLR